MSKHAITTDEVLAATSNPVRLTLASSYGQGSKKEFIMMLLPGSKRIHYMVINHDDQTIFEEHRLDAAVDAYNDAP